ncbi:Adenylylsulfatase HINT3 [Linum perenne]
MESRRLSIIRSHLLPTSPIASPSQFSPSISSSKFMTSAGDENTTQDCVFCSIVRGDSPAFKLYEDDVCLCILDRNPLSHGHSLIIPKNHFSSLDSTPPSLIATMCSKAPFIANALMKASGSDSFNLLVNNGAAAGQVIYHSLPRYPLIFDQEASHLVSSVREQLLNVSSDYKGHESGLPRCSL